MKNVCLLLLIFLLSSCAVLYKTRDFREYVYYPQNNKSHLRIYLCPDYLDKSGNSRYAEYAKKINLSAYAVAIKNTGDNSVCIDESKLIIRDNGKRIYPVRFEDNKDSLKQNTNMYYCWVLANFSVYDYKNDRQDIFIGPMAAFANVFVSFTANCGIEKDFKKMRSITKLSIRVKRFMG